MTPKTFAMLIALAGIAAWIMVWLPCVIYLSKSWANRRDKLFAVFGPTEIKLYYKQFFPAVDISQDNNDQLIERFKGRFFGLYGRRRYLWPLLLSAFVAAVGLLGTVQTIQAWVGVAVNTLAFPPMAVSAFLGAWTWVVNDQLSRLRNRDFTSFDVYNCAFRFLIAIPFGYALSGVANKDVGVAVAFLLGTFPTGTLFTYGRRLASQQLKLGEGGESSRLELESLQGVGRTNAERLMDEGFTTLTELAWADPVDLTIRTNRDFNYSVDCVSQALLWVYFGDKMPALSKVSLRGAQEAFTLIESLKSTDPMVQNAASKSLDEAAAIVGISRDAALYTLGQQVHDDPYTKFLHEIWH